MDLVVGRHLSAQLRQLICEASPVVGRDETLGPAGAIAFGAQCRRICSRRLRCPITSVHMPPAAHAVRGFFVERARDLVAGLHHRCTTSQASGVTARRGYGVRSRAF